MFKAENLSRLVHKWNAFQHWWEEYLEGARLVALPVLATRMHRWDVSCLRIMNLKLSALWPLVPLSSAKGGAQPSGGTMHAMPALQAACSSSSMLC